jgi:hypothetical protein
MNKEKILKNLTGLVNLNELLLVGCKVKHIACLLCLTNLKTLNLNDDHDK